MYFFKRLLEKLEDPEHPLLGPALKGLYCIALWRKNTTKLQNLFFNSIILVSVYLVMAELINVYMVRSDVSAIAENLYLTGMTIVQVYKATAFVYYQKNWSDLIDGVGKEEILHLKRNIPYELKIMQGYKAYARKVSLMYTVMILLTLIGIICMPIYRIIFFSSYRNDLLQGLEPLPHIIDNLWYPFDHTKLPGYILAILLEILASFHHGGITMVYDALAVALMAFLKGHLMILKEKCRNLFDGELSNEVMLERIRECHRHHQHLRELHLLYNSLLSPIMFMYLLVCSITICCCVIQFSLAAGDASEKLFMLQFIGFVISQLFIYCWHSSDVTFQSNALSQGLYESAWWRCDVKMRKNVLILGKQLTKDFVFEAGPFNVLSVATFIEILKASYSVYTFMTTKKN